MNQSPAWGDKGSRERVESWPEEDQEQLADAREIAPARKYHR
jgi:hypothetical protein